MAKSGELSKTESGYKSGGSPYTAEGDSFIKAIINMQNNKTEEDELRWESRLRSQLAKGVSPKKLEEQAKLRQQKLQNINAISDGEQEAVPDAAAAQRVELPKSESGYKQDDFTYTVENDPFVKAIVNTQSSQDVKRTSAAVKYDLDTLNKRYDALRQEAEAWESQAALQKTPEAMSEWERRSKAKRREAETLLPKIDALQQEFDTLKGAEKKMMMEQGGYREADLKDIIINSLKRGYLSAEHGKESYKEMMGDKDTRKAEYEELLAGEDYKFVPMHWWEEGISGGASLLGQQLSQAADPYTLALMGGFGGMAAAAGQAGPQMLLPEEVVTVPAALASGFATGSAINNVRIEAGNSYNELLEHGVSENTARAIAGAVGGINGALESLQLDSLLKSFGILKSTGASRTALGLIAEELKRRGLDVANNVAQEVLQEGTTVAGTQLGTKMETGEWAYGAGEVADRLKDTAISSALAFSALNVPGTIRSVGSNLSAGGTAGNAGQGIAAGKEAAFEVLDTDTNLGYDAFVNKKTVDGPLDISRDEGTIDPQRTPLIQTTSGQEKPVSAKETIRTSYKLKRPKLSKQEWRQVQSALMQKYAGVDEDSIPEMGYVFAHNKFYWLRNYSLGDFEVEVRLDPATQQDIINDFLEGKQHENDE